MNSRVEQKDSTPAGDIVRYAVALLLVIGGIVAFYWFQDQWPTAVRVLAVVAGLVLGTVVFLTSFKGVQTREFLSEARFELRKVVWPTREEATRTTWVVAVVIIVIALLLALFDLVIQWAVKWLLAV